MQFESADLNSAEAYLGARCKSGAGLYCDLVHFDAMLCVVEIRCMLLYRSELCAVVRHGAGEGQQVKIGLKIRRFKLRGPEICGTPMRAGLHSSRTRSHH